MTGPRAPTPADPADHPLRAALERGDRLTSLSSDALGPLLAIDDPLFVSDAIVAQVAAMFADLAHQIAAAFPHHRDGAILASAIEVRLRESAALREHCHALAIEWWLAARLEGELALDPVLSPLAQRLTAGDDAGVSALAMAALAAQTRFAQAQRRMQLPLGELPAEMFHEALVTARAAHSDEQGERALRDLYDESASRRALLGRLVAEPTQVGAAALAVEEAGIALWLSALAAFTGQSRERVTLAAADPFLARLLLTLRAAGLSPEEAERQAVILHPDARLPSGLREIGTREAAHWLAQAGR
jgi:hypothetical protein